MASEKAKAVGKYILARAKEPSTWRGIAMIATVCGAPAGAIDQFVQIGLFVVGLLGTLPDSKQEKAQ